MQIKSWPTSRPKPYPGNPRAIGDKAVEKVAASIKEFGFNQPVVVDKAGVVIVGHTRLLAAKKLGLKTVPVLEVDLPEVKARAYRLADNRAHEEAKWIDDLLRVEFDALTALDFDLKATAFDLVDIRRVFAATETGNTDPDAVPETPAVPAARLGDVWLLGGHRLVCGDATLAETVKAALGPHKPNLMVTDPPYGVDYDPSWRNRVKRRDGSLVGAKAVGAVDNDDRANWKEAWDLFPGNIVYVWHGGLQAVGAAEGLGAAGFVLRTQIIWNKQQFVIGRGDYHWQHEPCWYGVRKGVTGNWKGDRKQSSVWDMDAPSGYRQQRSGPDAHQGIHSTQKPVECMRRPMLNNSIPGDAVYDPFVGSGTTIIAAELTRRICVAVELNPAYVDVAIKRWQDFTGKQATLDGKPFIEVERERGKAKGGRRPPRNPSGKAQPRRAKGAKETPKADEAASAR